MIFFFLRKGKRVLYYVKNGFKAWSPEESSAECKQELSVRQQTWLFSVFGSEMVMTMLKSIQSYWTYAYHVRWSQRTSVWSFNFIANTWIPIEKKNILFSQSTRKKSQLKVTK
jgi:hypothetical protein